MLPRTVPTPGEDLLQQRLARAAALPPAERTADVAQWLLYAECMGRALDILGGPACADPQHADPALAS